MPVACIEGQCWRRCATTCLDVALISYFFDLVPSYSPPPLHAGNAVCFLPYNTGGKDCECTPAVKAAVCRQTDNTVCQHVLATDIIFSSVLSIFLSTQL